MSGTLVERIHREMAASDRAWTAAELCRTYLHMDSTGDLAGTLVRRILAGESRFQEAEPDSWTAVAVTGVRSSSECVWDQQFRIYWLVPQGDSVSDWVLHTCRWDRTSRGTVETFSLSNPDFWFRVRCNEAAVRWVGYQPNLLRRTLTWADRNWASTESELVPVDLVRWCRVADLETGGSLSPEDWKLPRIASRWNLGPVQESPAGCLAVLGAVLSRLSEKYPESPEDFFDEAYASSIATRPVDWSALGFSRATLEAIPEGPGIYRYWSENETLLYVGKSAHLSRRVNSYFHNFPNGPSRREELVRGIRRIECETFSSELEALLYESQAIREKNPKFNIQVEIHAPKRFPKSWRWPLIYFPPSTDHMRTVVGLSGPNRGGVICFDPAILETEEKEQDRLRSWCEGFLSEGLEIPPGEKVPFSGTGPIRVREARGESSLAPSEAWLALRYYSRCHSDVDRVDPLDIESPSTLFDLLKSMVSDSARGLSPSAPHLVRGHSSAESSR